MSETKSCEYLRSHKIDKGDRESSSRYNFPWFMSKLPNGATPHQGPSCCLDSLRPARFTLCFQAFRLFISPRHLSAPEELLNWVRGCFGAWVASIIKQDHE